MPSQNAVHDLPAPAGFPGDSHSRRSFPVVTPGRHLFQLALLPVELAAWASLGNWLTIRNEPPLQSVLGTIIGLGFLTWGGAYVPFILGQLAPDEPR